MRGDSREVRDFTEQLLGEPDTAIVQCGIVACMGDAVQRGLLDHGIDLGGDLVLGFHHLKEMLVGGEFALREIEIHQTLKDLFVGLVTGLREFGLEIGPLGDLPGGETTDGFVDRVQVRSGWEHGQIQILLHVPIGGFQEGMRAHSDRATQDLVDSHVVPVGF